MMSFLINVGVALIWLFLSQERTLAAFGVGFAMGFVLLAMFAPVIGSGDYVRRTVALLKFLVIFAREFLLSNLAIARAILFRSNESIRPNFVTYDVSGLTPAEILLLTHCVSLTPGTTTVEIAPDYRTVLIHCFDVEDPDEVRRGIDTRLRRHILAFTR